MRQLRVRLKHLLIPPSRMQVVEPRIPHRPVPMHLHAPRLRPRRRHHFPQRRLEGALLPVQHQESPKYVKFHLCLSPSALVTRHYFSPSARSARSQHRSLPATRRETSVSAQNNRQTINPTTRKARTNASAISSAVVGLEISTLPSFQ